MTANLTPEYLDALVARGYAHQPKFDAETVKLILDMADAITALRDRENAMVAAAFEAAARAGADEAVNYWYEARKPLADRKHGGSGLPGCVMKEILTLTPADATAALDQMLLAERNKVRREDAVAELWEKHVVYVTSKGRNPGDCTTAFSLTRDAIPSIIEAETDK